jgi:hypothetical protein
VEVSPLAEVATAGPAALRADLPAVVDTADLLPAHLLVVVDTADLRPVHRRVGLGVHRPVATVDRPKAAASAGLRPAATALPRPRALVLPAAAFLRPADP